MPLLAEFCQGDCSAALPQRFNMFHPVRFIVESSWGSCWSTKRTLLKQTKTNRRVFKTSYIQYIYIYNDQLLQVCTSLCNSFCFSAWSGIPLRIQQTAERVGRSQTRYQHLPATKQLPVSLPAAVATLSLFSNSLKSFSISLRFFSASRLWKGLSGQNNKLDWYPPNFPAAPSAGIKQRQQRLNSAG